MYKAGRFNTYLEMQKKIKTTDPKIKDRVAGHFPELSNYNNP